MPRKTKKSAVPNVTWLVARAARDWREVHQEKGWDETVRKFCPCGRRQHTKSCEKKLRQAVESQAIEAAYRSAIESLRRGERRGGPHPMWTPSLLVAAEREKQRNPETTDARLVEKYCPCLLGLDSPGRNIHTDTCLDTFRKARQRHRRKLRKHRLSLDDYGAGAGQIRPN